ncbi:MAG: TolC family protein [Halanaerobiales bacterium]
MKSKLTIFLLLSLLITVTITPSVLASDTLSLQEAVEIALQENGSLKTSSLDTEISELNISSARRNLLPELDFTTSFSRGEQESPMDELAEENPMFDTGSDGGPQNTYSNQFSLQMPIYMGGDILRGIDQSRMGSEISHLQQEEEKSRIILQVATAYHELILARERVKIEEKALELVADHKQEIKANIEEGLVLEDDLLQAEIQEDEGKISLTEAENALEVARENLALLLGRDELAREPGRTGPEPELELDRDKLLNIAAENSINLQILDLNREITEKNLEGEKYNFLPDVALNGDYSTRGEEPEFKDGDWSLTLSGSFNLFDGGKSGIEEQKYEKELEQNREDRENLNRQLGIEVKQKLLETRNNERRIEIREKNLENASENLRRQEARYQEGMGKNLDVLEAQNTLRQTELGLKQAEINYKLNLYELLDVTGQLTKFWEEELSADAN